MVVETVVKNGKIVSPGRIISGGIAIQDGKILANPGIGKYIPRTIG